MIIDPLLPEKCEILHPGKLYLVVQTFDLIEDQGDILTVIQHRDERTGNDPVDRCAAQPPQDKCPGLHQAHGDEHAEVAGNAQ